MMGIWSMMVLEVYRLLTCLTQVLIHTQVDACNRK